TEAHGLLRSDDGGATWHRPPPMADRCVTALAFSPHYKSGRMVAAATEAGIAISHDGGESWRFASPEPAEVLSLLCLQEDSGEVVLAGLHRRGVVQSADGGATWTPAN